MSAFAGFLSTWTQARATFGQGTPGDGSRFDQSGELLGLRDAVTSAAPHSRWTGAASDSYAEANDAHARTLGNLAEVDKRLGAEVDRSAAVVTAGRRDLDAVRKWVVDAAATVPNTAAGQRMLWPVVSKGSKDIQEIITRTNADLSAIAERIKALGGEYEELGDEGGGKGGREIDKEPPIPNTTFDIKDIKLADGPLGPANTDQIGPNAYYPRLQVGEVKAPPQAPLDYRDIAYLGPKQLGHPWQMELIPGSGAWIPDPDYAGYVPRTPEIPVDMATARILVPGQLIPDGMVELYPGASIAIPDPAANGPR